MLRGLIITAVRILWVSILALTGGRFLALLAGANGDSEIVSWLYRRSDFWVKPFFGMFGLANKAVENRGGVFEPASLVAFLVYLVDGLIVLSLLSSTLSWPRRSRPFYLP